MKRRHKRITFILAGLAGLGFELFHPGVVIPGAFGAICMVCALFGFSERAEQQIGARVRTLGWRVEPDRLDLGNAEPYRRDVTDPAHIWLGNGRATLITVP